MERYLKIIKECPLFAEVSDTNLKELLKCLMASLREYDKNEFIFTTGDFASNVGIVLAGNVHILQEDYWGKRSILARISPGELFGEAFSCAETESLPVSAIAVENAVIMLIDYKRIITTCSAACSFHTTLITNMLKILARKNIMLTRKIEITSRKTTREKLLSYLSAQAVQSGKSRFYIPFNRQELADYLSVERSAMSAELSRMQEDGLIWTNKSEFELFS